MSYQAVLMIAFGGPDKAAEIRPFLEHVTAGRPITKERFESVAGHYEKIGGRSPLVELTNEQAVALATALEQRGEPLPVEIGMRHSKPFLKDVLESLEKAGKKRVLGLVMAAHQTEASGGRYKLAVTAALTELGSRAPTVDYVGPWPTHLGFVQANAERIEEVRSTLPADRRTEIPILFTAHSIPVAMAQGSPYVAQVEATAAAVAKLLGHRRYKVCYQSRSGRPGDPWLEPDINDALRTEHRTGVRDVIVAPIGFVCDHVEVLYDLDVEATDTARSLSMRLHRAKTVGSHPAFIGALADAVQRCL